MCRTGARRCEEKWDDAHRLRYNARRRATRNTEKAAIATQDGDEAKAEESTVLAEAARVEATELDAQIAAHEADSAGTYDEQVTAWRDGISDDEKAAYDDYGSVLHEDINTQLRDAQGPIPDSMSDDERGIVERMDATLARAPRSPEPVTTYRGIQTSWSNNGQDSGLSADDWIAQNAQPGQEVTFHSLTSTSTDQGMATRFSGTRSEYATSGVVFQIQSTQGAIINDGGHENEVVLARNTTFEVEKVDHEAQGDGTSRPVVHLRETGTATKCPDCGQFAGPSHSCTGPTASAAEADTSYRMGHTAPKDDGYSNPLTKLTDSFPDDVYDHPDWYGSADDETMRQLNTVRDDPDATVRVYRAVPREHQEINDGDWITLSKDYADDHSYAPDGEARYVVVSEEVPAKAIYTDGNDLAEYGYTGDRIDFKAPAAAPAAPAPASDQHPSPSPNAGKAKPPASEPATPKWDRRKKYQPKEAMAFGKTLATKHGAEVSLTGGSGSDSYVTLNKIVIPKEKRGQGLGKKAMKDLVAEADRNGWKLDLTPSDTFGGSVPKLKRFYKEFGFVANKGRSKDFTTMESFLRLPK